LGGRHFPRLDRIRARKSGDWKIDPRGTHLAPIKGAQSLDQTGVIGVCRSAF